MRVKTKRLKTESTAQFLRRFLTRVQKSGIVLAAKHAASRTKKPNETQKKKSRLYRLKIQQFVDEKTKLGWSLNKSLKMARRYIKEIKFRGE